MLRTVSRVIAVALALSLAPALAAAAPKKPALQKHHVTKHATRHRAVRHSRGYGFLPGYRPPEVVERARAWRAWQTQPHYYGPAWPRFYRGRWNGGGFGPCYVSTPIGYVWTCGR